MTAATCCLKPIGSETVDSVLTFCGLEPELNTFSKAPWLGWEFGLRY